MKNYLLVLTLILTSNLIFAQSVFTVSSNTTTTITKANKTMFVDEWIMEDNSTIVIADDVDVFEITAIKAKFGDNCKIIGKGKQGKHGKNSYAHGRNGGECKDGGHGGRGTSGRYGNKGKKVKIRMGLISVNDLIIDVRGGNGGNGGNGANGGRGGRASCGRVCSGQEGGNGGNAGNAGNGGQGGEVDIEFWVASTNFSGFMLSNNNGLRGKVDGGYQGSPGKPGIGGAGGSGKRCPGFYKRSGGPSGRKGRTGSKGRKGKEGTFKVQIVASPS